MHASKPRAVSPAAESARIGEPTARRPRSSYRLMVDPVFGPFLWGKVVSSAGVWVHNIVAAIVAFDLTGSALVVGTVSAVQFAPQLVLAPLSGKMADRGNPGLQIVVGRLLTAAGSAGLAVWIWLAGGVSGLPGPGPVIAASLVVGLGFVVGGPAMQSIVPSLIRPGEMAAAMALNSVPMTVARAAGPALGALVATRLGPATAFAVAAAAGTAYAVVVLCLRLPGLSTHHDDTDFSVRAALRHLREDPPLVLLLAGIGAVGMGADPSLTLAPPLSEALGGDNHLVGWLASAFGVGAGAGFVCFGPLHRRLGLETLSGGGLGLMAGGLLATTAASGPTLALAMFGVCGLAMTLAFTSITTLIQNRTPDVLRGRIMALWFVGFLGARPVAAALNGLLADTVSVDAALVATAAVVAVAGFLCRPGRLR
jgi:predicted MFS family arabinose efflux permease